MLFDPSRHQKLKQIPWSESQAQDTVAELFLTSIRAYDPDTFWPTHADEDATNPSNKSLYFGAAGTLLGLKRISDFLNINLPFHPASVIDDIFNRYMKDPDTNSVVPSYFLGTSGIRLIHYGWNRSQQQADALFDEVESNIDNPVNEALWGCPGSMLASLQMFEWTGEERWKLQYMRNVDYLLNEWNPDGPQGEWVWTQALYGAVKKLVGAGHGFCGNAYAILKGQQYLSDAVRGGFFSKVADTLEKSALTEDGKTNWPVVFGGGTERILVQWCHGAPGVLTSLGDFPNGFSPELEKLFLQAGELIWAAGPLNKGAAICHGTDGNAMAFLKLFERTGNELWLKRARSFAMHARTQLSHRHTLWTGDIGLANVLISVIEQKADWLSLDTLGRLEAKPKSLRQSQPMLRQ